MDYKKRVQQMLLDLGVVLREIELERIEYTDFGLGAVETEGLNLFVYENSERHYGKELVLLPYQVCPEHRHSLRDENEGKKETFCYRKGLVYLYVGGKETEKLSCIIPKGQEHCCTTKKETILHAEDQYTIEQDIKHWFQADTTGAVIIGFSPSSDDPNGGFTNPATYR